MSELWGFPVIHHMKCGIFWIRIRGFIPSWDGRGELRGFGIAWENAFSADDVWRLRMDFIAMAMAAVISVTLSLLSLAGRWMALPRLWDGKRCQDTVRVCNLWKTLYPKCCCNGYRCEYSRAAARNVWLVSPPISSMSELLHQCKPSWKGKEFNANFQLKIDEKMRNSRL